jgi:hypothetical protein
MQYYIAMSRANSAPKSVDVETAEQADKLGIDSLVLAQTVKDINRARRGRRVRGAVTATVFAASAVLANNVAPVVHPRAALAAARATIKLAEINHDLNTGDKVAEDVTVEKGYILPLDPGVVQHASFIVDPIKLGNDTYAYLDLGNTTGEVTYLQVHATHPLKKITGDNKIAENSAELITPVANVFDEYHQNGQVLRYSFGVMGTVAGNVADIMNMPTHVTAAQKDEVRLDRTAQLNDATVGAPMGGEGM